MAKKQVPFSERCSNLVPRVVERAMGLISDRRRWTKRSLARDARGRHVDVSDPRAQQWCAVGAMAKCAHDVAFEELGDLSGAGYLAEMVQRHVRPFIQQAAQEVAPHAAAADIPQINDHESYGGYVAVLKGFALATGRPLDLSAAQREINERAERRSEAARKGWFTRRVKQAERQRRLALERAAAAVRANVEAAPVDAAPVDADPPVMTFGGTIVPSPAPIKEEVPA